MKFIKKPVEVEAITFDELIEYGENVSEHTSGDALPWSFDYKGHAVTHEDDDCYLINLGSEIVRMTRTDVLVTEFYGEMRICDASSFSRTHSPVKE